MFVSIQLCSATPGEVILQSMQYKLLTRWVRADYGRIFLLNKTSFCTKLTEQIDYISNLLNVSLIFFRVLYVLQLRYIPGDYYGCPRQGLVDGGHIHNSTVTFKTIMWNIGISVSWNMATLSQQKFLKIEKLKLIQCSHKVKTNF